MNSSFKIEKDQFYFRCLEKEFETFKRIEVVIFEKNFLPKIDKFFIRTNLKENINFILEEKINCWILKYNKKSELEKDIEKFLSLEDFRKNILYGYSLIDNKTKDYQEIMNNYERITEATQVMTFLFLKISNDFDNAINIVKNYDEPDEGDKIDMINLLQDFMKMKKVYLN